MNSISRTIYSNAHLPSLLLSIGAVMAGLTAAVIRGVIAVFPAIMTLLFAIFLQIAGNLYHGYFDLCYGAGDNIAGMADRTSRSSNTSKVILMRLIANSFGILALTAGLSLFTFVGWLGVAYFAIIIAILYFYFAGPKPIVRTKWSIVVTFLLFGPVAVSGTALIQNSVSHLWLPIIVYSVINGLLASNAHVAIQYLRYEEDLVNGKETIMTAKGGKFTRFVYLCNAVIVSIILIVRPSAVEFVSPWVGVVIGLCMIVSSAWVFTKMHRNQVKVSRMVRTVTMWQYIGIILTLMIIVFYSIDDFHLQILRMF